MQLPFPVTVVQEIPESTGVHLVGDEDKETFVKLESVWELSEDLVDRIKPLIGGGEGGGGVEGNG
jgi:hypothetical protein